MIFEIIGGFVTVLVGVSLVPVIANTIQGTLYVNGNTSLPTNVTGASNTIVGLTTLFFSLGVMSTGLGITVQGLRNAGAL